MKTLLFFGDSIMAGRGVNNPSSYVSRIEQSIQPLDPNNLIVHNLAIPGETAEKLHNRLNVECKSRINIPTDEPMIVLGVGLNDSKLNPNSRTKHRSEFRKFESKFERLITTAKKCSNEIIVMGLTPVEEKTAAQFGFNNDSINEYEKLIQNLCLKYSISFLDLSLLKDQVNKHKIFLGDGIHLNEQGHELVYEQLLPKIAEKINQCYDLPNYLENIIPGFIGTKIHKLKSLLPFDHEELFSSKLLMGQKFNIKPDLIIGGPCIRKDVEGISLNTFYQVFMPLIVAQRQNIPCNIFLGVKEEIILRPSKNSNFLSLADELTSFIKNLAGQLGVEVKILNTADPIIDAGIEEAVQKLKLKISPKKSTYLFSIFGKDRKKPVHSELRAQVSQRVLACHNGLGLHYLLECDKALIVEDLEQLGCYEEALKWDKKNQANFCTFIPISTLDYSAVMFKGETKQRLILGKEKNSYDEIYSQVPSPVMSVYLELFRLYRQAINANNSFPLGKEYFTDTLLKISRLLK